MVVQQSGSCLDRTSARKGLLGLVATAVTQSQDILCLQQQVPMRSVWRRKEVCPRQTGAQRLAFLPMHSSAVQLYAKTSLRPLQFPVEVVAGGRGRGCPAIAWLSRQDTQVENT